jgi:hypothetical protein
VIQMIVLILDRTYLGNRYLAGQYGAGILGCRVH